MLASQHNTLRPLVGHKARARPLHTARCVRVYASQATSKTGLTMRPGRESDLPLIRKLIIEEWMNPLGLNIDRFVVAEEAGQVKGFGQMEIKEGGPAGPKQWELRSLVVLKQFRGQGIAQGLVHALLEKAGPGDAVVLVTLASGVASALYGKAGFQVLTGDNIPKFMTAEVAVGNVVSRLAGYPQGLVVMGLKI